MERATAPASAAEAYEVHRAAAEQLIARLSGLVKSGPAPERTDWGHVGTIAEAFTSLAEATETLEALASAPHPVQVVLFVQTDRSDLGALATDVANAAEAAGFCVTDSDAVPDRA